MLWLYLTVGVGLSIWITRNDPPPVNFADEVGMLLLAGFVALLWPFFVVGSLLGRSMKGN